MLGAEFAVTRPAGLKGLVIANSPASMELWISEANRLRERVPPDVQATLWLTRRREPPSKQEMKVFYERHVCRVVPMPDEVARTFKAIEEDPTVYHTMDEFVIGTLSNSSEIIDRLAAINVPTLLISGRHDEATPATVQPYAESRHALAYLQENSSHMPAVWRRPPPVKIVGDLLEDADERAAARTGESRRDNDFAKEMRGSNLSAGIVLASSRNRPCCADWRGREADDRAALMSQRRGGVIRAVAKAAGGTNGSANQLHTAILAALPGDLRRPCCFSRRVRAQRALRWWPT